jgi:hypothetical protein
MRQNETEKTDKKDDEYAVHLGFSNFPDFEGIKNPITRFPLLVLGKKNFI